MNSKHIALVACSAALLGMSGISVASPTVYGKANVSLNTNDAEVNDATVEDNWSLNSNASRLGVKGDVDLEDGLSAIYKLEYEVAIDDGEPSGSTDNTFKQRNIYVGLKGNFGKVIAGKFDTPLKKAEGKTDRFNNLSLGDIKEVLNGQNRVSNQLMYATPDLGNIQAKFSFIPGEDDGTTAGDDNGVADATSASIKYTDEKYWVALAADSELNDMDTTRLVAEYSFEKAKVAALLQSSEQVSTGVDNEGYMLSGEYMIGDKWVAKGQYTANTEEDPADDIDTTMITLGADYKLAKKVKLYGYASQADMEQGSDEGEATTVGFGTEVKF
jgi:predicted porin